MQIDNLIKLRLSVIRLGEKAGWLPFSTPLEESESFLEYVLPKTKTKASLILAMEKACLVHDKNIQAYYYHLFRLPQIIEQRIHASINKTITIEDPTKELLKISNSIFVTPVKGPVNIGAVSELEEDTTIASIAKHYLEAFTNGYTTYPYLV